MFAEIVRTQNGDIIVKIPYVSRFVEELKASIPRRYRSWDAGEKAWFIDRNFADEIFDLVDVYFPDVETIDIARTKLASIPPAWARTLYIQPDAPLEVINAAYRALSMKYHPDRGGKEHLMKQLNNAIKIARQTSSGRG